MLFSLKKKMITFSLSKRKQSEVSFKQCFEEMLAEPTVRVANHTSKLIHQIILLLVRKNRTKETFNRLICKNFGKVTINTGEGCRGPTDCHVMSKKLLINIYKNI